MTLPSIEEQLRSYGREVAERDRDGELAGARGARPYEVSPMRGRRNWVLVAALVVFVAGLVVAAFTVSNTRPSAVAPVSRYDKATIAGYIAESSESLGGVTVGDPCPPTFDGIDHTGLKMVPVRVGILGEPSCHFVAWMPQGIPGLNDNDSFDQDGTYWEPATATTRRP